MHREYRLVPTSAVAAVCLVAAVVVVGGAQAGHSSREQAMQQIQELTGGNETGAGSFGQNVTMSADGNTVLVGGGADNSGVGAAWVFTRSGSTWTQQGPKLTASDEVGPGSFGSSVALSADGNTALIGGEADNTEDNVVHGAVWVFTRSGSTWTQQGTKLTPNDGLPYAFGDDFGDSVALSADGNMALIGGELDDSYQGAAWIFTRSGSSWSQEGSKLTASGETGPQSFGIGVALSADGNTALVGEIGYLDSDTNEEHPGAALVFTRSGSTWTQQGQLAANDEVYGIYNGSHFGMSVALSADGDTALIGSNSDNETVGAAWAFTRSGSTWTQQGTKLTANDEVGFLFGSSVVLSADGNTALIGGPGDEYGDHTNSGAAWEFTRSGSTWTQQGAKLAASDEAYGTSFGSSVALSGDGSNALVGGPGENSSVGSAWVFGSSSAAQYTLTVTRAGAGSGTVTGADISCPGTCSHDYAQGTVVSLTASAAAGSTFAGWSGGDCSGTHACQVSMTSDTSVTATFTTTVQKVRCVVPNVKAKALTAAKHAIVGAHCAVGKVRTTASKHVAAGRVISQTPAAGKHLAKGAKVNLVVSKGR